MSADVLIELKRCFRRVVLWIVVRALVGEIIVKISDFIEWRHHGQYVTLIITVNP